MVRFKTAEKAFLSLYDVIVFDGQELENTLYIQNYGFYIENPLNNHINIPWRKWKLDYAEYEWQWYLSENRNVSEIKQRAKIWDTMHSGNNLVNSNYGYQWNRGKQVLYVVEELSRNKNSRRAVITIYDGKENNLYRFDTPCTLNVVFDIKENKLNMSVLMRSCDLWYGFCNDQYCFRKLQEMIAKLLNIKVGWYYHFSNNLHLYNNFINKQKDYNANNKNSNS